VIRSLPCLPPLSVKGVETELMSRREARELG